MPEHCRERSEGRASGFRRRVAMHFRIRQPGGIGGAGGRQRKAAMPFGLDRDEVVAVAWLRFEEHDAGVLEHLGRREAGISEPGDVGASRPDLAHRTVGDPDQAAAGDPQHAHVERIDERIVAADVRIGHDRTAGLDDAEVGRRAADLEVDPVGHADMHQRARDARRGSGQHRHRRPMPHFADIHHAAVAAHDHQRRIDAGVLHARFGQIGGRDHPRQDRRIDDSGARPGRQSIQPRDLMPARRRKTELVADLTNEFFGRRIVDAERGRCHQHLGALRAERRHGILDRLSVQPVAEQELVAGLKHAPRREFDRIDANLRLREFRCLGGRQAQDSDPGHVAFQQRVGGLRRAVGEKDDVAGIDAGIAQDLLEHLDDARSDAVRMVMGGVNGRTPDDAAVDVVDQGGFGESSSYVDSDAIGFFAQDFVHYPSGPPETTSLISSKCGQPTIAARRERMRGARVWLFPALDETLYCRRWAGSLSTQPPFTEPGAPND